MCLLYALSQAKPLRQLSSIEGGDSDTSEGRQELSVGPPLTTPIGSADKDQSVTTVTQLHMESTADGQKPLAEILPSTSSSSLGTSAMEQSPVLRHAQAIEPVPSDTPPSQAVPVHAPEATAEEDQTQSVASTKAVPDQGPLYPSSEAKPDPPKQAEVLQVEGKDVQHIHSRDQSEDLPIPSSLEAIPPGMMETVSTQPVMSEGGLDSASSSQLNDIKKKAVYRKSKPLKLSLVSVSDGKVVKCKLGTAAGQMINFQFSMEYDKPQEVFQKMVCVYTMYMYIILYFLAS